MDAKELAVLIEGAVNDLHKATERQDAEIKAVGEVSAESKVEETRINTRIDWLLGEQQSKGAQLVEVETKLERGTVPNATATVEAGEEAKEARTAAFYKYIRQGKAALTPEERKTLVEDATGLYLVTPELDTEIVRALPQLTIMRGLCTIRTIGKESIKMRSLSEASVGWGKLETGTDPTESTLTPGAPTYQYVEDLYGLVKIGEDELMDSDINLEPILADSFARALGVAEEVAFVKGAGHASVEPAGITLDATLITNTITTAAANAVAIEDFLDMLYECPTQFRRSGSFVMNSATELAIRKLREVDGAGTEFGAFLWQPSIQAGLPNTFLGKPVHTQDDMETLAGAAKVIAIFGDFKAGYRILDRSGITLQRLTELYSEAGLVGFKIHKRVGGSPMRASQKPLVLLTEHDA